METGQCLKVLEGHRNPVNYLVLSADGRRVVSGSWDKTLRIWDMETGQCLKVLEGHTERVTSLVLSADGRRVVSGSRDKTLRIWDMQNSQCLGVHFLRGVYSMGYQSRTGKIVAGFGDGRVEFYKIHNLPLEPFITTANREIISVDLPASPITARPPCCGQLVFMPETVSERINHGLLHGGDGGYNDPALLIDCPSCGKPLRMNPFFVDVKPIKK
jgi:WD40 repeat protein